MTNLNETIINETNDDETIDEETTTYADLSVDELVQLLIERDATIVELTNNNQTIATKTTRREIDETILENMNTSTKIRTLLSYGWSRSEIAKFLGVRYQHVRGVEMNPLKTKTS